jgi:integrase
MIEKSFSKIFFLKTPRVRTNQRFIYLRVTVDGIPKEVSVRMKWDILRWDQVTERAIGNREDARSINYYLDSLSASINNYRIELMNNGKSVTSQRIIEFVKGNNVSKAKVLEEFRAHNDEIFSLVKRNEYAKGTYERYVTACSHVSAFIKHKYNCEDIEFRDLNYEFIRDYELYLKTIRECSNNTTLKYIANFKKIVYRAISKEIISTDPFILFKGKKNKTNKKPLSSLELNRIENKAFANDRLNIARDVFVFQCYTGLAYIDVYQLRPSDIKDGIDGSQWIMSTRQKTKSVTDIPLLPKALEIVEKYKNHPICIERSSVLPVRSNQKMNSYLKEIATLCLIDDNLTTHKARRTFASTVTLKNGVPIHIVKEMMGHQSVKQTEEYAITEQESISSEMLKLKDKLQQSVAGEELDTFEYLKNLEKKIEKLTKKKKNNKKNIALKKLNKISRELKFVEKILTKRNKI